ncbi:hypothetical protein ACBI99_45190 [Nonomuraea sp. ATR24]|uniref:hypothetical protein n=1 Tax=Nonomuraea TaxID=83681 RepID=UPI001C5EDAF2|nr:hypothetical protein [Nonomuraea ceibae]
MRLRQAAGAGPDHVWRTVREEMSRLLAGHRVERVVLERAEKPPEQSVGDKFRRIIPLTR